MSNQEPSNLEKKQEIIGEIKDIILDRFYREKNTIITALIDKAKRGDVTALKEVLERALGKENNNSPTLIQNNFNLSDEQFNRITLIRAKRISGVLAGSPVSAGSPDANSAGSLGSETGVYSSRSSTGAGTAITVVAGAKDVA